MADIVISIVTKVSEYLVEPAIREGKYIFCVNEIVEDFENEKNELISERDNLVNRVEQAKHRAEEIEKSVEKWLSDVESLLKEVEDLNQQMKANKSCFQGRFPTWTKYHLCKKMVKKENAMMKLKGKSNNIQPFSHRAPLPGIQYRSLENFTYFESTKVAYDQLLEALEDDKIYMIGVYGMGGSGKTTLVTEASKKVEGLKFDKVVLITVSQTPNIRVIQGQMADALNIKLEDEHEEGRAQRLWLSLKQNSRLLIIVDDLWKEFNLMDIGIHLDNDNKGAWKIILTTRNQHICDLMQCQKNIYMGLLREYESWALFQKHAKVDDRFSESLDGVPQKLCNECKGLPIAIKAVGSSLKGKSNDDWKIALHNLAHPDFIDDEVEGVGDALSCLKLSYDYLGEKKAKMIFLMCSMFPEDYKIAREDLIRYAIGLDPGRMFSLGIARSGIEASINRLLESCLLMDVDENKEYVKMHDMVRDTALWIAKGLENHKILVNVDKPFSNMVEDNDIRDCFAISSWYEKEDKINHLLHAPNLKILLIRGSKKLSDETFEGIEGLQVLSIINDKYGTPLSLPLSVHILTNLRTLRLQKWKLGDISFISNLKKLEVLDLQECILNELPKEVGDLKRLKLLDLSSCDFLENYHEYNGAIGKCSQLEELYVSKWWQKELYSQCVEDIITLPNLQRFVSYSSLYNYHVKSSQLLHVVKFNISMLKSSKNNLLQIAEAVHLEQLNGGFKNVVPEVVRVVGGMNGLTYLHLTSCQMIERVFDTPYDSDSEVDLWIPKLVELVLMELECLKEFCRGTPAQVLRFFEKLEKIIIFDCHQLQNIFPHECNLQNLTRLQINNCKFGEALFSMPVARSLQQLEELIIEECNELKHIIANAREQDSNTRLELVTALPLWSSHFVMPKLKKLHISSCRKLVSIFPICCFEVLAFLEEIYIGRAPALELVFGECDHQNHSSHQCQNQNNRLCLKQLTLYDLENLVGICPENNRAKWPSTKCLTVMECPKLSPSWIATMVSSEVGEVHYTLSN
ncbi:probable disease resistance protein At4g27220 [Cicer arietinum]|uniref:Disease resistance protein At5g05400 n=1 Tax=Cicer arietinum TaxID=3827 RepID=A0A1S2Z8B2_CICAR|nr:putative disease resistance protein At5g05400 [Cicer arietinum]